MRRLYVEMADIPREVSGKAVSRVSQPDAHRIDVHFTDDSVLAVEMVRGRATAIVTHRRDTLAPNRSQIEGGPTRRQQDYLEFIAKYIARYRVSPAESDIALNRPLARVARSRLVEGSRHERRRETAVSRVAVAMTSSAGLGALAAGAVGTAHASSPRLVALDVSAGLREATSGP